MCGIAGIIVTPNKRVDRQRILSALERQKHRGPDDAGVCIAVDRQFQSLSLPDTVPELDLPSAENYWQQTSISLGHRRLTIIDLSPAAHQPMLSEDRSSAIVFNGEVYNYLELAHAFEELCGPFGDTAVVHKLLARRWAGALPEFSGMFAFCFVDLRKGQALLARDPFGIKPLYYAQIDGGMAFASEIKALLELVPSKPTLQPQRAYEYLGYGQSEQAGETMFAGIYELPPGTWLEIDLHNPHTFGEPKHYWQPESKLRAQNFEAATAEFRRLFHDSVRLHLRSDTPVGAALSGGIDSSSLVTTMRQIEGPKLDLHTFTYRADDEKLDESAYAQIVAKAANAIAHVTCPEPTELAAQLNHLIYMQDLPFNSTSIFAQYKVFELAREVGIKVTLDGQGADELFAGYDSYLAARLASLIKQGRYAAAMDFAKSASRRPSVTSSQLWKQAVAFVLPTSAHTLVRRIGGEEAFPSWLNSEWLKEHGVKTKPPARQFGKRVLADYLMHSTTKSGLPTLLRYADRNSMAHSIESRVPFLTVPLAEFAFSQPEEHMIDSEGSAKCLVRAAMRGVVPDEVLDRKDKIGFITPEAKWLAGPASPGPNALARLAEAGIVNREKAIAMLRAIEEAKSTNTSAVWRCINFTLWCELYNIY